MKEKELAMKIGVEITQLREVIGDYLRFLFEEETKACDCGAKEHEYIPKDKDDWTAVGNFMYTAARNLQLLTTSVDNLMGEVACNPSIIDDEDKATEIRSKMMQKSTLATIMVCHLKYLRKTTPPCDADKYYDLIRKEVLEAVDDQVQEITKKRGGRASELLDLLMKTIGGKQIDTGLPGVMAFEVEVPPKDKLN